MRRPTGHELVAIAEQQLFQKYAHKNIPKGDRDFRGEQDCAETHAWTLGVSIGKVCDKGTRYIGCYPGGDAHTAVFVSDAEKYGVVIPVDDAKKIAGAILLRLARDGKMGHVAMSDGTGNRTIEAHSKKNGVCRREIEGRVWDLAWLAPGVDFAPTK